MTEQDRYLHFIEFGVLPPPAKHDAHVQTWKETGCPLAVAHGMRFLGWAMGNMAEYESQYGELQKEAL